jgi:hypothetical protein
MAQFNQLKEGRAELECDCGLVHKINKTEEGYSVKTFGTITDKKGKEDGQKKEDTGKSDDGKSNDGNEWEPFF